MYILLLFAAFLVFLYFCKRRAIQRIREGFAASYVMKINNKYLGERNHIKERKEDAIVVRKRTKDGKMVVRRIDDKHGIRYLKHMDTSGTIAFTPHIRDEKLYYMFDFENVENIKDTVFLSTKGKYIGVQTGKIVLTDRDHAVPITFVRI